MSPVVSQARIVIQMHIQAF